MNVEIGTVRPICGLQKLIEASSICIVQLKIVLKHFISNGCVSVWYNIPFVSHLSYLAGTRIWLVCLTPRRDYHPLAVTDNA